MNRQGLVRDLPEADYHGGPELSASGAKLLLRSPALYRYRKDNPEHRDAFDFGSVVHGLILGTGWPVKVVDADDWRGKAAREARDEARAAGEVPILRDDWQHAVTVADAVHSHPTAGPIFASDDAEPEVSVFWADEHPDRAPVACRARVDWLHPRAVVDLKTCADASPQAFARAAVNFGYDLAAAAYLDGVAQVTDARPYLLVAVEKEPPYHVAVYKPDDQLLDRGARLWAEALDLYAACSATDEWPGYPTSIQTLEAPSWAK